MVNKHLCHSYEQAQVVQLLVGWVGEALSHGTIKQGEVTEEQQKDRGGGGMEFHGQD